MTEEKHLQGKICLVTGSTSGIGKVTAKELANRGATVVLVSRSRAKGEATQAAIKQATGNQHVELLVADLSVLEDVRRLATEFQQTHRNLHLLVNNAGCAYPLARGTFDTREPHSHVAAEPINRVVRPSRVDRLDRKLRPLRKLCRQQPPHERNVDIYLVGMHFATRHEHLTLAGSGRIF